MAKKASFGSGGSRKGQGTLHVAGRASERDAKPASLSHMPIATCCCFLFGLSFASLSGLDDFERGAHASFINATCPWEGGVPKGYAARDYTAQCKLSE